MKWPKREKEIENLFKKYGKGKKRKSVVDFPNLKIDKPISRCSDVIAIRNVVLFKKELHPDAKEFPIGHQHKQGLELLTPDVIKNNMKYMGGQKT